MLNGQEELKDKSNIMSWAKTHNSGICVCMDTPLISLQGGIEVKGT